MDRALDHVQLGRLHVGLEGQQRVDQGGADQHLFYQLSCGHSLDVADFVRKRFVHHFHPLCKIFYFTEGEE